MRLWHKDLIEKLPRQQLLGQHRECCALRGKGWGKKHSTVNYVFNYPISKLYNYHNVVMNEMKRRGYKVSLEWKISQYRGKQLGIDKTVLDNWDDTSYNEHDEKYMKECIENLKGKGIII